MIPFKNVRKREDSIDTLIDSMGYIYLVETKFEEVAEGSFIAPSIHLRTIARFHTGRTNEQCPVLQSSTLLTEKTRRSVVFS